MEKNKVKDNRNKPKLKIKERILIEHYYMKKKIKNYSYIGKQPWKDRKTINREIKRNGYYNRWWHCVYKAKIAEMKTMKRRLKANRRHIKQLFKWEWREFVEKIKKVMKGKDWSIKSAIWRYELEKWKKAEVSYKYNV